MRKLRKSRRYKEKINTINRSLNRNELKRKRGRFNQRKKLRNKK